MQKGKYGQKIVPASGRIWLALNRAGSGRAAIKAIQSSIRLFCFLPLLTFLVGIAGAQTDMSERVIIRTAKPYYKLVAAIQARGGVVTNEYRYVDAIAATIPVESLSAIGSMPGVASIANDIEIRVPTSVDVTSLRPLGPAASAEVAADSVQTLTATEIAGTTPAAYSVNNTLMAVEPLHNAGFQGQGIIVAVIDSGIRPGFPHISNTVIGGEDFVGDGMGYSNFGNNGHGTFVSGMIASHVGLLFANGSTFVKAVKAYAPEAAQPYSLSSTLVPLTGTAPAAKIYALRVLGTSNTGWKSKFMQAMERVIELRKLYDSGDPGGLNIRVCNMSFGGATLEPGLDPQDQLVDLMLANDIVPVISASNAGPATLTVGSPASSNGAVSVGAASLAHNERIFRDVQYGSGVGALYRPFGGTLMAYFSSRGPNANGRVGPSVVANGQASLGMGYAAATNVVSFSDGTSFAAPTVAGIAAVLRQAFPSATARQVRNAIIMSANPTAVSAASNVDQGAGFVNAAAARDLLAAGKAPDTGPTSLVSVSSVRVNVQKAGLNVFDDYATETLSNLGPGERHDIVFSVKPNTSQLVVSISGFSAAPPEQQNVLFGDELLLAIHSAKTSQIGEGDYLRLGFTIGGTFIINRPEPGLIRISVNGAWINAKPVSATVTVIALLDPIPQFTAQGKIAQSEDVFVPFNVPAGTKRADFRLSWRDNWGTFPTANIDLFLISPSSKLNRSAATGNSPETTTIDNPEPGTWVARIAGPLVPLGFDKFELRIALDGVVIH